MRIPRYIPLSSFLLFLLPLDPPGLSPSSPSPGTDGERDEGGGHEDSAKYFLCAHLQRKDKAPLPERGENIRTFNVCVHVVLGHQRFFSRSKAGFEDGEGRGRWATCPSNASKTRHSSLLRLWYPSLPFPPSSDSGRSPLKPPLAEGDEIRQT